MFPRKSPIRLRGAAASLGAIAFVLSPTNAIAAAHPSAAGADHAEAHGQEHAGPRSQEIGFAGAGDVRLEGTLVLPEGEGPFPAVLLLPGSGPTDRDGNQPPMPRTDLLRQIADDLADRGVASYRFDKRAASVNAGAWPESIDEQAEFFAWENFVADAEAALRTLIGRDGIDAERVGIVGHSEGGLIALAVADRLRGEAHAPATLVLAGTAGRRLDIVMREQFDRLLPLQIPDPAMRETISKDLDRAIEAIRTDGNPPDDLHPLLAPLFNPTSLDVLRAYFTVEPTELAGRYTGPVLVINGDMDIQVSAERDLPEITKALEARRNDRSRSLVVKGASHNFKTVRTETEPGFQGPVVPEALDAIGRWLTETLDAEQGGG